MFNTAPRKAFTMIELIVVIVILGILALIAIPTFAKVIAKSEDEATLTSLSAVAREAQALHAFDGEGWKASHATEAIQDVAKAEAGVQAAGTYTPVDENRLPEGGEIVYTFSEDGGTLGLAMLSGTDRVCAVAATVSSIVGKGCVDTDVTEDPAGEAAADPDGWTAGDSGVTVPDPGPGVGAGSQLKIAAGHYHTAAVTADGDLYTWGQDDYGQLGNGTAGNQDTPVKVTIPDVRWADVTAGDYHTVAVTTDGDLYTWGYDAQGQLGNGATTGKQHTPVKITVPDVEWANVTAGNSHTAAVTTEGELYTWGWDYYGQLGNGTAGSQNAPVKITAPDVRWANVTAGYYHTVAVTTEGDLYTWGNDDYGQLGNGTAGNRNAPVKITVPNVTWAGVAAGTYHTAAVTANGDLYTWGYDAQGQLGNGTTTGEQHTPVKIAVPDVRWANVTVGLYHTVAVTTEGDLYTWGYGYEGQLGNGTAGSRNAPSKVTVPDVKWADVTAGYYHTVAVTTNGDLYTWGLDDHGQLGNGATTGNQHTPVPVSLP